MKYLLLLLVFSVEAAEITDCDDPFIEPVIDMEKMEVPNVP